MPPSPRVLLSIDYEPWFALVRRYDGILDSARRCELDGGFTRDVLDPILNLLHNAKASFYLVGEIAGWHPEIPQKITGAGHELGLHCQVHRRLNDIHELAADIEASLPWRKQYRVRGYRAPMVGISEAAYPMLEEAGLQYSSSMYAPAGTILRKGNVWEIPVSTLRVFGNNANYTAPRDFTMRLLGDGEIPYGSSFTIGLMSRWVLKILRRELKAGRSPVIILHPYELVRPSKWISRLAPDLILNPLLLPFTWDKRGFLAELVREFPISPLGEYLDEAVMSLA